MEYKAYQVRTAVQQALSQVSAAQVLTLENAQSERSKTAPTSYIDKNIGDEVLLETIKYKVLSSKEQSHIQSSLGSSAVPSAGAKFIIVTLRMTNLTNADLIFPYEGIPLVDSQGRQYSLYDKTIGNIDNYLVGTKLPPSVAKEGVEVFEVPSDASGYYLVAAKGGTNDIYRVKLQ